MVRRTLLFDIGNVLVTFDFTRATLLMAEAGAVGVKDVMGRIHDIKEQLESGKITEEAFYAEAIRRLGFSGDSAMFDRAWCDIFAVNEPMLATLNRLPEDVRLVLLSNTNEPHKRWLLAEFPQIFSRFEGGVFSHEAGWMKPVDQIYQQVLDEFNLQPEMTFYIDDLPANVEAGRRWGLHSFQYDLADHSTFQRALDGWLAAAETEN